MIYTVRVRPNARQVAVEELEDGSLKVAVVAAPEKGAANRAVVDALAKHFSVSKSQIQILAGHVARTKIVEIR